MQKLAYNRMHLHLKKRNQEMQAQTAEARALRAKQNEEKPPEEVPTMANKKDEIQAYMDAHEIKYRPSDKKKRLLRLIEDNDAEIKTIAQ